MLDPDVTEILDDPEVGGGVSFLIRRPKMVRHKGTVELEVQEIPATGNIQPEIKGSNQSLNEDNLDEQIVIRSTTYMQSGTRDETGAYQMDEVIFHGNRYRVTRTENWADWGFVTAHATRVRE